MSQIIRSLIREVLLAEGGLKLARVIAARTGQGAVDMPLIPSVAAEAIEQYESLMDDFNVWLQKSGNPTVKAIKPVGSVARYKSDLAKEKLARERSAGAEEQELSEDIPTYGDIDYLVEFPIFEYSDDISERDAEKLSSKRMTDLFVEFLNSGEYSAKVDVSGTIQPDAASPPTMVIFELSDGNFAQVDTIIVFPSHSKWASSRYIPPPGVKGYIMGNLLKALGDYLTLTIGIEGVISRTVDGKRVGPRIRKGVDIKRVSVSPEGFFVDIVREVAGDVPIHAVLQSASGFKPGDETTIPDLATGIAGVILTLGEAEYADPQEMAGTVLATFSELLEDYVVKKEKDITPKKAAYLRKSNQQQLEIVRQAFADAGLQV